MDIYVVWSFYLGLICAGSLLLGAWIGFKFNLSKNTVGLMAAFGSGALLCALALELVAPTVETMLSASDADKAQELTHFLSMVAGAGVGGVIFVMLDQILIEHGGYLRKTAYILAHQSQKRKEHQTALLQDMAHAHLFTQLTPEQSTEVLKHFRPDFFNAGEQIFNAGEPATELILIRHGNVALSLNDGSSLHRSSGDMVGEIPILSHSNHLSDCLALTNLEVLVMPRCDVEALAESMPEFLQALRAEAAAHLEGRKKHMARSEAEQQAWIEASIDAAEHGRQLPSTHELASTHASHGNAAIAIWLGNVLDGIPESFVLGTILTSTVAAKLASNGSVSFSEVLPYTLIAGLFLSNLPEALSSSAQMRTQGMSATKVFAMWGSLVLLTGLGAALGATMGEHIPHAFMIFAEGIAAGAMLTMICAAMLPEAVHLASPNLAGMFTLGGFLSALLFKLFEL